MKLGVVSDVHGDPVALELTWARLMMLGAERIVCAGDVVGYGPEPDAAVAFLAERQIPTVRGNHDRWALERPPGMRDDFGGGAPSEASLEAIRHYPPHLELIEGHRAILVAHGAPGDDMQYVTRRSHPPSVLRGILEMLTVDVMIVGHTHRPMWYRCDRGLVMNPGSLVSIPRVRSSRSFAVIDLGTLEVTFHDVETGRRLDVAPWADDPAN